MKIYNSVSIFLNSSSEIAALGTLFAQKYLVPRGVCADNGCNRRVPITLSAYGRKYSGKSTFFRGVACEVAGRPQDIGLKLPEICALNDRLLYCVDFGETVYNNLAIKFNIPSLLYFGMGGEIVREADEQFLSRNKGQLRIIEHPLLSHLYHSEVLMIAESSSAIQGGASNPVFGYYNIMSRLLKKRSPDLSQVLREFDVLSKGWCRVDGLRYTQKTRVDLLLLTKETSAWNCFMRFSEAIPKLRCASCPGGNSPIQAQAG